jgi:hypothetical protein
MISVPGFNGTSYIAYPVMEDALRDLRIDITFQADSTDNAVLLYDAFDADGTSDFIQLVIKDGYVQMRYDLGSGLGLVEGDALSVDQWTTVVMEINQFGGSLSVNGGRLARGVI